jgi:DNA-binding response OmpR family regulator
MDKVILYLSMLFCIVSKLCHSAFQKEKAEVALLDDFLGTQKGHDFCFRLQQRRQILVIITVTHSVEARVFPFHLLDDNPAQ